jgi:hypothetical protein
VIVVVSSPLASPIPGPEFRRKILTALFVGPVFAVLFALVFGVSRDLWPIGLILISPVGIGLAAGIGARLALPGRRLLAWILASSSSSLGLLLLGWLTAGSMGLNPGALPADRVAWGGLLQLSASIGGAWLSTHAWNGASPRTPTSSPAPPDPPREASRPRPSHRAGGFLLGRTLSRWRQRIEAPEKRVRLPRIPDSREHRPRGRPGVRLGALAEERCPYCLDIVRPGDPRGVRRCEVCHTAHHADCWAQTGTCQVLHHQG